MRSDLAPFLTRPILETSYTDTTWIRAHPSSSLCAPPLLAPGTAPILKQARHAVCHAAQSVHARGAWGPAATSLLPCPSLSVTHGHSAPGPTAAPHQTQIIRGWCCLPPPLTATADKQIGGWVVEVYRSSLGGFECGVGQQWDLGLSTGDTNDTGVTDGGPVKATWQRRPTSGPTIYKS